MRCLLAIVGRTEHGENKLQCQRLGCEREGISVYGPELVHFKCWSTELALIGDNLHNLLRSRFGISCIHSCGCQEWIKRMNHWGPEGCREHLESIVDKMLTSAEKRNWKLDGRPLLSAAACIGTKCSWGRKYTRRWACKLVLEAIERSERSLAKETN